MLPPPPDPESYLVAVLDLLGYADRLEKEGLAKLYETYYLMLDATSRAINIEELRLTPDNRLVSISEAINCLVASDTIMLWATRDKAQYFVAAIARLVMGALQFNAPLRGAVAYGNCIFDIPKKIFIGDPVVKASRAEQCQDWIGVGVLEDAVPILKDIMAVVGYGVPLKPESREHVQINQAIAWHWAQEAPDAAEIYLERQRKCASVAQRHKYDNALNFVRSVGFPD